MKRLFIIFLMLWFTNPTSAQNRITKHKDQLQQLVVNSFNHIWSTLNSANIVKYYTNDFLLLENGEVWNHDSIRNYLDEAVLKKPMPRRVNTIDVIEIKIYKKRAWIAYHNNATFSINDSVTRKAHWLESAAAILTSEGWKLEMLHSTVVKKE